MAGYSCKNIYEVEEEEEAWASSLSYIEHSIEHMF
jgi:hypothetical protein